MIKKILIVDDSPVSVKIMKSCIPKDKGYEFSEANNGEMGVEKYKEFRPDVTFMDLTMPVMNGFDAMQAIIKYDENALVVIVTADIQIKAMARAHDLGAFAVVKKPPAKETIAAVLEQANKKLAERC